MKDIKTERLLLKSLSSTDNGLYDLILLENNEHIGYITIDKKCHISYYIEKEYRSTDGNIKRYTQEAVIGLTKQLLRENKNPSIMPISDPLEKIQDKSEKIAKSCGYTKLDNSRNYVVPVSTEEEYEKLIEEISEKKQTLKYMDKYKVEIKNEEKMNEKTDLDNCLNVDAKNSKEIEDDGER